MKRFLFVMSVLMLLILVGCGGGGGGTGAGGAVSGKVPYLVSGPSFTLRSSPTITGKYDVTVTIEADGPTGVYAALVWITDENDWQFDAITVFLDIKNRTAKVDHIKDIIL